MQAITGTALQDVEAEVLSTFGHYGERRMGSIRILSPRLRS